MHSFYICFFNVPGGCLRSMTLITCLVTSDESSHESDNASHHRDSHHTHHHAIMQKLV